VVESYVRKVEISMVLVLGYTSIVYFNTPVKGPGLSVHENQRSP
jgi:hypothetical protein